jgi:hypothetical protein
MDQAKEFLEMPREFVKDGRQFITRCSKRTSYYSPSCRTRKHKPSHLPGLSAFAAQQSAHQRLVNLSPPFFDQHATLPRT